MNSPFDDDFQPTIDGDPALIRWRARRNHLLALALSLGVGAAAVAVALLDRGLAERLGNLLVPALAVLSVLSMAGFFALANLPRSFDLLGRWSALIVTLLAVLAFNWLVFLIFRLLRLAMAAGVTPGDLL